MPSCRPITPLLQMEEIRIIYHGAAAIEYKENLEFFALAYDESTDVMGAAQKLVFIDGSTKFFLYPLKNFCL